MNDCWPGKLNVSSNDLLPWKQYVGRRLEVFVGSRYKIRYSISTPAKAENCGSKFRLTVSVTREQCCPFSCPWCYQRQRLVIGSQWRNCYSETLQSSLVFGTHPKLESKLAKKEELPRLQTKMVVIKSEKGYGASIGIFENCITALKESSKVKLVSLKRKSEVGHSMNQFKLTTMEHYEVWRRIREVP